MMEGRGLCRVVARMFWVNPIRVGSYLLFVLAALRDQGTHDVTTADDSEQFVRVTTCDHGNAVVRLGLKQLKGASRRIVRMQHRIGPGSQVFRSDEF